MSSRIVIVTGGSEGIGYAIAKRFLKEGDVVVITSRREAEGKKAEAELGKLGEVTWYHTDVAVDEQCRAAVEFTVQKYGRVDVLVNNAGVVGERLPLVEQDMAKVEQVLRINVMGTIQMIKYSAKYMKEQGKGVVVNIGSLCGSIANTESVAYHASKGAIRMVTQSLAKELSEYGIRVVSAAPGWVRTGMLLADIEAHGSSLHMKNRVIEPAEIAGAVFLLASDDASAINGSTVMVDDGYTSFKI